jgi:L-arabinokinase
VTRKLVFYISGHGFGHASRVIEVINDILARRDDVEIVARTNAPAWLFDRTIGSRDTARAGAERFRRVDAVTDTGVAQIDSLHLDEAETVRRAATFMREFAPRVAVETAFLRAHGANLVVADIPALGIAAARGAAIPAIALGNFTWDWIYSAYDGAGDVARQIADVYATADLAIRLPMHGGFASFERIVDVPLVARRSSREAIETRRALGLPLDQRLVLVSFGGYGLGRIRQDPLTRLAGYYVIGGSAHPLDETAMYGAGMRYEDLVRAVDVVVSKPGYGIISECIANDTALLYTSRGRFREYDVFEREMPHYLRTRFITHDDLFAGRWQPHLDRLLAQPPPSQRPNVTGAAIVTDLLLDMI